MVQLESAWRCEGLARANEMVEERIDYMQYAGQ